MFRMKRFSVTSRLYREQLSLILAILAILAILFCFLHFLSYQIVKETYVYVSRVSRNL